MEIKKHSWRRVRGKIMSRRIFCRVLLVVVAVFAVLVLSGILSAQGNSGNAFERVKAVQEKHTARLMSIKGVVGTAVGHDQEDRPDIKVFVEEPGVAGIPKKLDDVSVEVVVTGKIYALKPGGNGKPPSTGVDPTARFDRPVPIGVSTGHPNITAGTIGCRVKDGSGNVYALSNNHVYANENRATIGDNVLQPGHYDGGKNPEDAIGKLSAFVSIKFDGTNNTIDAAIAAIIKDGDTPRVGKATPSNGYGTPKSTTASASVKMQVQKYGRTTGLTTGKIYAKNATVDVWYGTGVARFVNQLIITPGTFSAGGDSGSLIVKKDRIASENNKPVGLLFAGSDFVTIANPIGDVLSAFGVTVDGQ
jgi:hypothetical protein